MNHRDSYSPTSYVNNYENNINKYNNKDILVKPLHYMSYWNITLIVLSISRLVHANIITIKENTLCKVVLIVLRLIFFLFFFFLYAVTHSGCSPSALFYGALNATIWRVPCFVHGPCDQSAISYGALKRHHAVSR